MRNGDPGQKKLKDLLKEIGAVPPPVLPESDDPLAVLILSFLTWESTTAKAVAAFKRIREGVVDFNDLRVCLSEETQEIIGPRYPRGLERCQRLRAVLRNIYHREHAVTLDRLEALSKRDIRRYLLSLEGIVPYVVGRVMLLCYDAHGIPVDDQLRAALIEYGAADSSGDIDDLSSWLARQIKAGDGAAAHYALQAWIDGGAGKAEGATRSASGRRAAAASRKTSGSKPATKRTASAAVNKAPS